MVQVDDDVQERASAAPGKPQPVILHSPSRDFDFESVPGLEITLRHKGEFHAQINQRALRKLESSGAVKRISSNYSDRR